jgi:DNA-binding HxlR family transcriptional regulator
VLKHLTSRWGVLVLIVLADRAHRFSELRRDSMVEWQSYPVVPPHFEYTLTPLGRQAAEKVRMLADFIETSMPAIQRT